MSLEIRAIKRKPSVDAVPESQPQAAIAKEAVSPALTPPTRPKSQLLKPASKGKANVEVLTTLDLPTKPKKSQNKSAKTSSSKPPKAKTAKPPKEKQPKTPKTPKKVKTPKPPQLLPGEAPLFQAIGLIKGLIVPGKKTFPAIQIGSTTYQLYGKRKTLTALEIGTELILKVYPTMNPQKQITGFYIVNSLSTPPEDDLIGTFILKGIWHLAGKSKTPVITIYRNQKRKSQDECEPIHAPLKWDEPTVPAYYTTPQAKVTPKPKPTPNAKPTPKPKLIKKIQATPPTQEVEETQETKETQATSEIKENPPTQETQETPETTTKPKRYFIQVKAQLLADERVFQFSDLLTEPSTQIPRHINFKSLAAKAKAKAVKTTTPVADPVTPELPPGEESAVTPPPSPTEIIPPVQEAVQEIKKTTKPRKPRQKKIVPSPSSDVVTAPGEDSPEPTATTMTPLVENSSEPTANTVTPPVEESPEPTKLVAQKQRRKKSA